MSTTLFPSDTLFSQRMLKAEGLYFGRLDGLWGPLTEKAANDFEHFSGELAKKYGTFDLRTEINIKTLTLRAQQQARQFMVRVRQDICDVIPSRDTITKQSSIPVSTSYHEETDTTPTVKIISGTRSYADQNRLFRQGRYHNPGNIITNARGGSSAHNFGIAWDIGIFTEDKGYVPDGSLYDEAAKAGQSDTLEWGGDWTRFVDRAHYQLKLTTSIKLVRQQFEAGEDYLQPA